MGQKVSPVDYELELTVIGIQDGMLTIKISQAYYMKISRFVNTY